MLQSVLLSFLAFPRLCHRFVVRDRKETIFFILLSDLTFDTRTGMTRVIAASLFVWYVQGTKVQSVDLFSQYTAVAFHNSSSRSLVLVKCSLVHTRA